MNFNTIKAAVGKQFERMQSYPMFRVDATGDELWATYLASFPEGSNPIFRERTEHDCSCCRQFIRAVGNVVAVIDGAVVSVWDGIMTDDYAYNMVRVAMAGLVRSKPITGPFLHYEPSAGTHQSFEMDPNSVAEHPTVKTWTHFFVNIDRKFVKKKADIPALLGVARADHDVFLRSLREITTEAIDTVLELIAQGSLYRGEEHAGLVSAFKALRMEFNKLVGEQAEEVFAWTRGDGALARIRNTVIGSLLVDLSEGVDLEVAVKAFEAKVAPMNYKRPTALITKGMIEKAKEQLEEMGLTSALDRRFARIGDITVNNVIFADRAARKAIGGGDVFDDLAASAGTGKAQSFDKVEEVPIDQFIAEIVPRAESIEVMFENRHQGNLVSLIAPVDPTARPLFKWDNGFSWSYVGEVADSVKERVKKAGGNVTGDLCCRLAWSNFDDLDFHMVEPSGYEIYYANRHSVSPSGGRLDVDMNVYPTTREPVENIFYASRQRMREGEYRLFVHQFNRRDTVDVGFECEIDYLGQVHRFGYEQMVAGRVEVAQFRYTHKGGFEIIKSLPTTQATRIIWGLPTQTFHRVSALTMSPNHWDGAVGNRHFFFMLDGCRNDGTARGFFNEFLKEELTPHRKVFEMVASKMKPADSDEQLSGLGFSSTQRNTVVCRVRGSFTRTIKVVI